MAKRIWFWCKAILLGILVVTTVVGISAFTIWSNIKRELHEKFGEYQYVEWDVRFSFADIAVLVLVIENPSSPSWQGKQYVQLWKLGTGLADATKSDADLHYARNLQKVTAIAIHHGVTTIGIAHIPTAFPNLRHLQTNYRPLISRELQNLTQLPALSHLMVYCNEQATWIEPTAWNDLAKLQHLEELHILNTQGIIRPSYKDLAALKEAQTLQKLVLQGVEISAKNLEKLRRALPHCRISHVPTPGGG